MKGYIYGLKDPIKNEIRYIGQTTIKPSYRYRHHLWESKNTKDGKTRKNNWILKLLRLNKLPELIILEEFTDISSKDLDLKEIKWISFFKNQGNILVNSTNGGKELAGKFKKYRKRTEKKKVYSFNEFTKKVIEYKNVKEAAKVLDVDFHNIPKAIFIKGRCKGLFLSYSNNFDTYSIKKSKITRKICAYNDNFYKEYNSIKETMEDLNIPKTCRSRVCYRLDDGLIYKGFYFKRLEEKGNCGNRKAHLKQGELLENPFKMDNQHPSLSSNTFEGSTTNSQVLNEDSNANTSTLHPTYQESINNWNQFIDNCDRKIMYGDDIV